MIKRAFDICFSFLTLVALSPVFAIIAVLIKLDSPGPVFYRGERVGRGHRVFRIYKFRTMITDAENKGSIHAARSDPRITGIGKFLRALKLDELPQLINVLKGEMSVVGPRPQVKHYVNMYSEEEKKSLEVLPGMTDPATIRYIAQEDLLDEKDADKSYREKIEPEKNRLRVRYASENSFCGDMRILVKTLSALFFKTLNEIKRKSYKR